MCLHRISESVPSLIFEGFFFFFFFNFTESTSLSQCHCYMLARGANMAATLRVFTWEISIVTFWLDETARTSEQPWTLFVQRAWEEWTTAGVRQSFGKHDLDGMTDTYMTTYDKSRKAPIYRQALLYDRAWSDQLLRQRQPTWLPAITHVVPDLL